jgi:hypothetical protein
MCKSAKFLLKKLGTVTVSHVSVAVLGDYIDKDKTNSPVLPVLAIIQAVLSRIHSSQVCHGVGSEEAYTLFAAGMNEF